MDEQLIESARDEAAMACDKARLAKTKKLVEGVLRDHGPSSLESIKQPLRRAKSPRMRTCVFYRCDKCNDAILDVEKGFIIHGNVYVADPARRGGLIGNNFPNVRPGVKIEVGDVQENVFCRRCLLEILDLEKPSEAESAKPIQPKKVVHSKSRLNRSDDDDDDDAAEFMRQLRELDQ